MNRYLLLMLVVHGMVLLGSASAWRHPGLLHTMEDINRMHTRVAAGDEPWQSGFVRLRDDTHSSANWRIRGAFEIVRRDPRGSHGNSEMVADCNAAYQNALMWCVNRDMKYARKSAEIMRTWAGKLELVEGHDAPLAAALNGFKFVNAAEILRYTCSEEWPESDALDFEKMLLKAILPPLANFSTHANGNWGAACIKTVLAIGVYCERGDLVEMALDHFRGGSGNGALTNYVISVTGQSQESGRDQQHTQLGLALLAEACEVAWSQGIDLYGSFDNRLLKGFEYTARYNLGYDVAFEPHVDTTGKYRHREISDMGRGKLRPIYAMVWNHYSKRCGMGAPFTREAMDRVAPEGAAFHSDHPGFGTLLFSL